MEIEPESNDAMIIVKYPNGVVYEIHSTMVTATINDEKIAEMQNFIPEED